jgi:hypothetical protein
MANKEAETKRRVERARQQFAAYSARLQEEQRSKQMFPSTMPGDRGAVSPLGGLAEWPWGGEKKGG